MSRHDPILEKTTSPDGTPIACWRSGRGPALLLVHGSTVDHTRWASQLALLEPHATVYAMDRRERRRARLRDRARGRGRRRGGGRRRDAAAGRVREPAREAASTAVLAAALPGARIVTIAGQGHVAMLTGPDLFATEVLTFLRVS